MCLRCYISNVQKSFDLRRMLFYQCVRCFNGRCISFDLPGDTTDRVCTRISTYTHSLDRDWIGYPRLNRRRKVKEAIEMILRTTEGKCANGIRLSCDSYRVAKESVDRSSTRAIDRHNDDVSYDRIGSVVEPSCLRNRALPIDWISVRCHQVNEVSNLDPRMVYLGSVMWVSLAIFQTLSLRPFAISCKASPSLLWPLSEV